MEHTGRKRTGKPSGSFYLGIGGGLLLLGILWGFRPIRGSMGTLLFREYEKSIETHFLCWERYARTHQGLGVSMAEDNLFHYLTYFAMGSEYRPGGEQEPAAPADAGEAMVEAKEPFLPGTLPLTPPPEQERPEPFREESAYAQAPSAEGDVFLPHEKQRSIDIQALSDYETLLSTYYTIDASTMAGTGQLNGADFLTKDFRISKETQGPQILIYHTHSQEGYLSSGPGKEGGTVVDVGDQLARILEENYGYQVLHHRAEYDKETRNNAYSRALPELEELLKENPSIQVVIDLHRDEMPEGTRLVQEVDGRPTARFMFFNGLSRTKTTGDLDYLYNPYQEENLAFSFQMEVKAMEYYPGLTRKNYLKGYRYNMHLCPRTLLIELGAQNNTLEEAMNACGPLAHILDLVLAGENS